MMTHEEIKAAIERLRSMKIANRDFIVDVCRAFIGNGEVTGDELHYTLIELLEQANPVNHMELPKDADGEYIHIGDEVCGYNHPNGGVYCHAIVNPCVIAVGELRHMGDSNGWALWNTLDVRHYHKPTVEELLREFGDEVQRCCDTEDTIAEYAAKIREAMA
jgi:hypothetical protein